MQTTQMHWGVIGLDSAFLLEATALRCQRSLAQHGFPDATIENRSQHGQALSGW